MELTRRDALAALAGAGIVGGGASAALARDRSEASVAGDDREDADDAEAVLDALVGTAQAVYPSAVENVESFVRTYGEGKIGNRPEYRRGAVETRPDLAAQSDQSFDRPFAALDDTERGVVLRRLGADTAEPDPAGTTAERVRYYFVNEALYALYTSPTGGELVGIENPQGYPGGTDSYQRGPDG